MSKLSEIFRSILNMRKNKQVNQGRSSKPKTKSDIDEEYNLKEYVDNHNFEVEDFEEYEKERMVKEKLGAEEEVDENDDEIDEKEQAKERRLNEGQKPTRYGVNRKIIYGIGGVIIVAFVSSTIFSNIDSNSNIKKDPEIEIANSLGKGKRESGLPENYEDMARMASYDGKNANQNGKSNVKMIQGNVSQNRTQEDYSAEIPAIASGRNYSAPAFSPSPYPVPQLQTVQQVQNGIESAAKAKTENAWKSAIRFTLETGGSEQTEGNAVGTAQQGKPSNQGASMYQAGVSNVNALYAGTIIPAMLMNGVNSEVGGQAIAQITENIYDSWTGSILLIPMGSRMFGQYDNQVNNGQSRIDIKWTSLVLPNGASYQLGSQFVSVDEAGYAGIKGRVNNHTSKVLGSAALTSALAAVGSIASGNTNSNTNGYYNVGQLAASGAAANLLNTASTMINKNINIQPTITVEPGTTFNILVNSVVVLQDS